jgi:hypothetical protein
VVAPPTPAGKRPRRGLQLAAAVAAALAVTAAVVVAVVVSRPDGPTPGPPAAAPTSTAPQTATVPDPATADPCSLLDVTTLQGFGTASLDPDNVTFAGCRADIERPDGGSVGYTVTFENETEVAQFRGGTRMELNGYTVITYGPADDYCEERILLADGNAVLVSAVSYEDPTGSTNLCAIVEAGRGSTVAQLVQQGIGQRARLDEVSPLAGIPACNLLTSEEIATAVANPTPARPRFADWGCDWASFTGGGSVAVSYYRGYVLGDSDGSPADFSGHPGRVLARDGNCWVQFVQRAYSAGGSDRIEAVWVTYWGSGTGDELCQSATTLATAAASRLPEPS